MDIQFKLNDELEFIPEFNGNKELPEDKQVKVVLRYLTVEEFDSCVYLSKMTKRSEINVNRMAELAVKEIRNLGAIKKYSELIGHKRSVKLWTLKKEIDGFVSEMDGEEDTKN